MPALCTSALSTCADRSAACTPDRPPLRLPTGERTASTMTASAMTYISLCLEDLARLLTNPLDGSSRGCVTGGERGKEVAQFHDRRPRQGRFAPGSHPYRPWRRGDVS